MRRIQRKTAVFALTPLTSETFGMFYDNIVRDLHIYEYATEIVEICCI